MKNGLCTAFYRSLRWKRFVEQSSFYPYFDAIFSKNDTENF